MSAGLLVATACLLGIGALREVVGGVRLGAMLRFHDGGRIGEVLRPLLPAEVEARIQRAGLSERVGPGGVLGAKLAGAAFGALLSPSLAAAGPQRLGPLLLVSGPIAGFLAPDLLLSRMARRRRAAVLGALPDALDLLGVGVAGGRAPERVLVEIAAVTGGPLAAELSVALAEVECGASSAKAMRELASRVPGPEMAGLVVSLERARRLGSPLADDLHDRAATLRREARGRLEERAARAAPKIQLVVALLLVPSVMLMLLAALIAHAGALFPTP